MYQFKNSCLAKSAIDDLWLGFLFKALEMNYLDLAPSYLGS